MKRNLVGLTGGLLLAAATLSVLTACGGAAGTPPSAPSEPTAASATATAPDTGAGSAAQTAAQATRDELLARGKLLYDTNAGGTGCAYCHGLDGKGSGAAGVGAPPNRGASEEKLRDALAGGVPLMTYIKLTEEEINAVVAYLRYLNEQP